MTFVHNTFIFEIIFNIKAPKISLGVFDYKRKGVKNMYYSVKIPRELIHILWQFRENNNLGSINSQVRRAVEDYVRHQEQKLGRLPDQDSNDRNRVNLVQALDAVVEDQGEPSTTEGWFKAYDLATEKMKRLGINN